MFAKESDLIIFKEKGNETEFEKVLLLAFFLLIDTQQVAINEHPSLHLCQQGGERKRKKRKKERKKKEKKKEEGKKRKKMWSEVWKHVTHAEDEQENREIPESN